MRDDDRLDPELAERLAAALGVHDDAVEVPEQTLPELELVGRAAGQQVVRGEDRRALEVDVDVDLRHREPLQMQDVGTYPPERARHPDVLGRLQRQPCARAPEQARRQRIEALRAYVSIGRRQLGEAEMGRRQLDIGAGPGERARELVVVPRGVSRRICDHDAHGRLQ